MSIIFIEGFDGVESVNGSALVSALNNRGIFLEAVIPASTNIFLNTGRTGSGLCLSTATGAGNRVQIISYQGASLPQGAVGIAAKADNTSYRGEIFRITDANGIDLVLGYSSVSAITLTYDPAGTANDISQTFTLPISTAVYSYYEIRWTSSLIEVAFNNSVIYTKTQVSQAGFTKVCSGANGNSYAMSMDDIYVADDANFRGDMYVKFLSATGTGTNTGTVVGNATAHGALTSFDGDTSYVNYTADGQKTLLTLSDIIDDPASIHAVSVSRSSRKSDTGSVSDTLLLSTATENAIGNTFTAQALLYSGRRAIAVTDPADGQPWTKVKVNGMQSGIRRGS